MAQKLGCLGTVFWLLVGMQVIAGLLSRGRDWLVESVAGIWKSDPELEAPGPVRGPEGALSGGKSAAQRWDEEVKRRVKESAPWIR